jgi:hypothetical protein
MFRSDDEVNDAFAAATTAATGSAVVYLTHWGVWLVAAVGWLWG